MKTYLSKLLATLIIIAGIVVYMAINVLAVDTPDPNKGKAVDTKTEAIVKAGYLENVLFAKLSGKERITLVVSQQPNVNIDSQADNKLLIKLENMIVSENLRRVLGENELSNIVRLTPLQQEIDGKQWIYLAVDLKDAVPYSVKQEGQNIYVDFNVSVLPEKKPAPATKTTPVAGVKKQKTIEKKVTVKADAEIIQAAEVAEEKEVKPVKPKKEVIKRYTDRMISIDFQDADIKSVLRLMAEYGNVSIVSGDDVKGNVTLTMKNVPWDQALEAILDVNGLSKKQTGDVISVLTHERKKKDEADRVSAEDAQRKAEDQRKARETQVLAEKGKLRQILIEAKIVEATEEFIRNIGVQWGFMNNSAIGSYGLGVSGGSSTLQTGSRRQVYPEKISWTEAATTTALTMAAVNFPAAVAAPTIGLVFGSAAGFLETQLAALESNTTGKIISSPKVVTMDNVKATIKQGDEVPYVTPASGTSPATITFREALLRLDVKPRITDEGRISMEIKATNDVPDYARGATLPQGNPPIRKNEVESTIVVQDGDTVVIGGVLRSQEDNAVSGLPWLQKIPILGWLFKTETTNKTKRQLLIFITPKILKSEGFNESAEKIIN